MKKYFGILSRPPGYKEIIQAALGHIWAAGGSETRRPLAISHFLFLHFSLHVSFFPFNLCSLPVSLP